MGESSAASDFVYWIGANILRLDNVGAGASFFDRPPPFQIFATQEALKRNSVFATLGIGFHFAI